MIKQFLVMGVFAACMAFSPVLAADPIEAPVKKITEMLYPTVMVDMGSGVGSGTVIFSNKP